MALVTMRRPNHAVLASRFIESAQWDRALEAAGEWLTAEPESARAHQAAGQSLINLDRSAEAERHITAVLAAQPENDFAHRLMSIIRFRSQRFKEADESIAKAISLNPRDALHWYYLGHVYQQQGDLANALKYAKKAQEIDPRNASVLNLIGICSPKSTAAEIQAKREFYLSALELNPEGAALHNNLGACYLDEGNYGAAEAAFRQALALSPQTKLFRSNLFLTLKHRDPVYRILCAPKDCLAAPLRGYRKARKENIFLYLLLLPVWLLCIRFVLVGLLLWALLVWPLVKVYELLTVVDIHDKAGEIGAQRGGFLGYRRWSLHARLGLFGVFLILFWGGIFFSARHDLLSPLIGWALVVILPIFAVKSVRGSWKRYLNNRRARKRSRTLKKFIPTSKKPSMP